GDGPAIGADDLSRIGFEVDMRLADVWSLVFERGRDNLDDEFLAWVLRLSYVTGYWDSLSEPERGALCTALGYPVPDGQGAPVGTDAAQPPVHKPIPAMPTAKLAEPRRDADEAARDGIIRASVSTRSFRSVG